jgi:hypothetical protein
LIKKKKVLIPFLKSIDNVLKDTDGLNDVSLHIRTRILRENEALYGFNDITIEAFNNVIQRLRDWESGKSYSNEKLKALRKEKLLIAVRLHERLLERLVLMYGAVHEIPLKISHLYALFLSSICEYSKADDIYARCLSVASTLFGDTHRKFLEIKETYARNLVFENRFDEAKGLYMSVLDAYEACKDYASTASAFLVLNAIGDLEYERAKRVISTEALAFYDRARNGLANDSKLEDHYLRVSAKIYEKCSGRNHYNGCSTGVFKLQKHKGKWLDNLYDDRHCSYNEHDGTYYGDPIDVPAHYDCCGSKIKSEYRCIEKLFCKFCHTHFAMYPRTDGRYMEGYDWVLKVELP